MLNGESFVDVIREGRRNWSTISNLQLCGIKTGTMTRISRYVVLFTRQTLTGELQSSDEGKVWWEIWQSVSSKTWIDDMSDMLRVFLEL